MAVGRQGDLISVVLPAHNEAAGIAQAVRTVHELLARHGLAHEIIVVDDGSRDATFAQVQALQGQLAQVRAIRFSRNFGKEAALLAGLRAARGDAVVTMDADLQHPPEVIPQMVQHWRAGARVVHGVKQDRRRDGILTRGRAWLFNALMTRLGGVDLHNASDFKLLDRVAVDVLVRQLPERGRFFRGLADWVGFSQSYVHFTVGRRHDDSPGRWSLMGLIRLATTALLAFTSAPLHIVTLLGVLTLLLGLGVGGEALWSWLHGEAVSGFTTIILTLLIIGSFIMISLGIVGAYIGRIYDEIKGRPPYLVEATCGFEAAAAHGTETGETPRAA